jgi:hypothetical protein
MNYDTSLVTDPVLPIANRFSQTLLAFLDDIRDRVVVACTALRLTDWMVDSPEVLHGDEFMWGFMASRGSLRILITVRICEQSEYEEGNPDGITFKLGAAAMDGEIIAEHAPFNSTDEVWVSRADEAAVTQRFTDLVMNTMRTDFAVRVAWALEKSA